MKFKKGQRVEIVYHKDISNHRALDMVGRKYVVKSIKPYGDPVINRIWFVNGLGVKILPPRRARKKKAKARKWKLFGVQSVKRVGGKQFYTCRNSGEAKMILRVLNRLECKISNLRNKGK